MKPTSYHAFHDWDDRIRIKDVILEALADGLPHEDVLKAVLRRFPRAQTTINCVQWYASRQMNRDQPTAERALSPRAAAQRTVREAIAARFADPEVLQVVHFEHPTASTTLASIQTTRSAMRKTDPTIPTSLEARILQGLPRR